MNPALKPTPKIAAAGTAGIATTIIVFLASRVAHVDLPEEIAAGLGAFVTWLFGYLRRDKSSPAPPAA